MYPDVRPGQLWLYRGAYCDYAVLVIRSVGTPQPDSHQYYDTRYVWVSDRAQGYMHADIGDERLSYWPDSRWELIADVPT